MNIDLSIIGGMPFSAIDSRVSMIKKLEKKIAGLKALLLKNDLPESSIVYLKHRLKGMETDVKKQNRKLATLSYL